MKIILKIIIATLVTVLLFSCSPENKEASSKQEKTIVTNPNGDSELALAMRLIFDQTNDIKVGLKKGELELPENYIRNLKKFHTAIPTDPEVKIEEFFAFVNAIDLAANQLKEKTNLDDQKEQYSRVINACIQCHKSFCPGPIRRINKLKL